MQPTSGETWTQAVESVRKLIVATLQRAAADPTVAAQAALAVAAFIARRPPHEAKALTEKQFLNLCKATFRSYGAGLQTPKRPVQ